LHSIRQLVENLRSRPKARLAVVFIAVANHMSIVAFAAAPAVIGATVGPESACGPDAACSITAQIPQSPNASLPAGTRQCGNSGPGAACSTDALPSDIAAGTATAPAGLAACAETDGKSLPFTGAACSDPLPADASPAANADPAAGSLVMPSVPVASLGALTPTQLTLTTSAGVVPASQQVVLTATANSTVATTDRALEIFDLSASTLIAACGTGSQCSIAYAAGSGTHEFGAFVTVPTTSVPDRTVALPSNHVSVGWLDSAISVDQTVVGQGQSVTVTVTSTVDVRASGRRLEIYDLSTGSAVTYCSRGTRCSTSLKQTVGGEHELVAYVNGQPEAVSKPVYVTWLDVSLTASSIGPKTGGTVYLRATTNADLAGTPWVVGIYDEQGLLVDHACKTGTTCSVQAWMSDGTTPKYTAVIGALPPATPARPSPSLIGKVISAVAPSVPSKAIPLIDVQAKSATVEPTHLLWGVDSCKAFTGDPTGELYPSVVAHLGTPEFWGRYLTNTVCPGISSSEVALAARHHLGILPIYNDYNCSAVSSYATGHAYAVAAVAAANNLGIPTGRLLAIDIEPPGDACPGAANVDSAFIDGWYEGVHDAGYVPVFYGNGTVASEFANAWCAAVSAVPSIGTGSDLWSFEPSLLGGFNKTNAPNYAPADTGCPGNIMAWQYVLSAGGNPDVDQDEALSSLPLWFPEAS
jgi:hypothetical protein